MGINEFWVEIANYLANLRGAATFVATLAVTAFGVWLTSTMTVRQNVRQKVWQDVYAKKREEFEAFTKTVLDLRLDINRANNLQLGFSGPYMDTIGRAMSVVGTLKQVEALSERCAVLESKLLVLPATQGKNETKFLADTYEQLRNWTINEMRRNVEAMNESTTRLVLVAFDPAITDDLLVATVGLFNGLATEMLPWKGVNLPENMKRWSQLATWTLGQLRKDLDASSESLTKAVAHSPSWGEKLTASKPPQLELR